MRIRTLGRMAMSLTLLAASTLLVAAVMIDGRVTAVNSQSGVLTVQTATDVFDVQTNAQSTYTSAGQPSAFGDVRVGDRVSVEQTEDAGVPTAKSVAITPAGPVGEAGELPKTASWLPRIGLLGALSLGAGLLLRQRSRTSARIEVQRGLRSLGSVKESGGADGPPARRAGARC